MRMKNKKAFDLPFSWIFSIIVGAVIIFLAIFVTTSLIKTSTQVKYSQSAQELLNLLNPVVNGVTSAYSTRVNFNKETRIELTCDEKTSTSPFFGRQSLTFAEESGFLKKWLQQGVAVSRYNKYIFSRGLSQGKTLFLFSKPFYAGFRVDDVVIMTFDKYCFVSAPSYVEDEVTMLNLGNVNLSDKISSCPKNYLTACFGFEDSQCNISIMPTCSDENCGALEFGEYGKGYVSNFGKTVYYYGSELLYAAIFSSPEIYECNIKRLGNKASELALIYRDKIDIVKIRDCNSLIGLDLEELSETCKNLKSSLDLYKVYDITNGMDDITCEETCRIYAPRDC